MNNAVKCVIDDIIVRCASTTDFNYRCASRTNSTPVAAAISPATPIVIPPAQLPANTIFIHPRPPSTATIARKRNLMKFLNPQAVTIRRRCASEFVHHQLKYNGSIVLLKLVKVLTKFL